MVVLNLVFWCILLSTHQAIAEGYKDSQGYKDYLKLPDSYKSPEMEAVYKNGFEAKQKVKNLPAIEGGTVEQYLDQKAKIPAVDDLGWNTIPYQGGFSVERVMLLDNMKVKYEWFVDSNGVAKAINGKAMQVTK